ncbi:hypothetical protein [Azospirillum sp. sgz301742]
MTSKIVGEYNKGKVDKLLTPEIADKATQHRVMHFLENLEGAILEANCQVMGQAIPHLNQDAFLKVAVRVAELRADYIKFGLEVAENRRPSLESVEKLTQMRRAYEEMVQVFEAAERVIERGYVKLG